MVGGCRMEEEAPGSQHHFLSSSGNMLVIKCHRAAGASDGRAADATLSFCRFSFDRDSNKFVRAAEGAAALGGGIHTRAEGAAALGGGIRTRAEVLTCRRVINFQKRVCAPCVLAFEEVEGGFEYSLFALSRDRLELCLRLGLPYEMEEARILRGPAVAWRRGGDVISASLQTAGPRRIPVQVHTGVFGELPLCRDNAFVIGVQELSDPQSAGPNPGCLIESGDTFDGSLLLPGPYTPITLCMLVLSAERTDCNKVTRSAVVAATSQQQLVYFEDGVVKKACQLPFGQPSSIQIVDTGRSGSIYVVSSQQGHACAVWKETFQMAASWSSVDSVHVDDFLGCGTEQILVVFKDRGVTRQPLETFLLTDLCGITYASCQFDEAPKASSLPENHFLTLQALESRLQDGLGVLHELQREAREKERVLQNSVQALTEALSDREPSLTRPEQEGLIALWDCDDESKENALDDKTAVAPAVSSKPQVDSLWHRIIEDQMVVGVTLTADSSAPMASVSLSIVTEADQRAAPAVIQTQSQAFWLPAPCSSSSPTSSSSSPASMFLEPAAKRSKQHNDLNTCRLAVTAVTRLTPLLNSACVKCSVMLHYIQKQDAFALASGSNPHALHCGSVALDIHGDFQSRLLKNPQLKTAEVTEDLLSLMTVLDHWVFLIDSPDYSLGDVEGWIQKRFECRTIELNHQYFYIDSPEPSTSMLLRWCQVTTFQGELSVHSSQLKMLQFLDSFLTFLPASCSIRPAKGTQCPTVAETFSVVLEKEVASLRDSLSSLLCDDDKEDRKSPGPEAPEPGSTVELQGWRDLWQLDVEKSRKRLHPLVEVGRYRSLMQRLYDVQLNVDLVALLDAQRTLLS